MTFSNKPHFLAVVSSILLLLIALTVRAEMDRYIVKVMPVPAGWVGVPLGINDRGDLAGYILPDTTLAHRQDAIAVVWKNGHLYRLDDGIAMDVNNSGQAAGTMLTKKSFNGFTVPVYTPVVWSWDASSQAYIPFLIETGGLSDNLLFSRATQINDRGEAVGTVINPNNNYQTELFLWQNGGLTWLGQPVGCSERKYVAINNRSEVLGSDLQGLFVYRHGEKTYLTTDNIYPMDINDLGQGIGNNTAVSWLTDINSPLGEPERAGNFIKINNAGVAISGESFNFGYLMGFKPEPQYLSSTPPVIKNFLTGEQANLLDQLTPADRSRWETVSLTNINDAGQMAAIGVRADGGTAVLLLTPESIARVR